MVGKIPVAILGATGTVGQKLALLLENHPYFEVHELFASERSSGTRYGDIKWLQSSPVPEALQNLKLKVLSDGVESPLCFSALDASIADTVEIELADRGHWVVTNAKSHRMDPTVPLIVPEINWQTWKLVEKRWKKGGVIANPNCCVIGISLALFPLYEKFGLEAVHVVTLQAVSGAGYPGVASLDIFDNVIPHISDEVEKIEEELPKIFGVKTSSTEANLRISAQVNRVPVIDGHVLVMSAKLGTEISQTQQIDETWAQFNSKLELPSSPRKLYYHEKNPLYPQPRLHRDREKGMSITIGPVERCSVLDYKFTALVHNTLRGAAGGTLLIAEALHQEGVFSKQAVYSTKKRIELEEAIQ